MAKITAPNEEFTGKRGQVAFVDGKAGTDDPSMIAYFKRHGYEVEGDAKKAAAKPAKKAAAKPDEKPAGDSADASPSEK